MAMSNIVKIVLEENVSRWMIRAEDSFGVAKDLTDRKERAAAEEIAKEWAASHGLHSYAVSLFPRGTPDQEVPLT